MKNKRYIPIAAVVLAALPLASAAHAERNASVNAAGSWSRLSTTPTDAREAGHPSGEPASRGAGGWVRARSPPATWTS